MRKLGLLIVGTLTTTALVVGLSTALAAHAGSTCTGTLASGKYHKLVVPAGATCDGTEANIHVRGGVRVGEGATFILGSEELGTDTGTIRGGIRAKAPASLQVHFAHINGGLRMRGGNGFFSTVEDNVIHGGATINGYSGFWLGFIRNKVHGTVKLNNNDMQDPDANEFVTNTIKGSLVCHGNSPAPQVGDSEGQPNVVSGRKVDQCAGL
ncbi:MAG: hypothetical protein ACRDMH_17985 [Solirubrobacterales bacterium]